MPSRVDTAVVVVGTELHLGHCSGLQPPTAEATLCVATTVNCPCLVKFLVGYVLHLSPPCLKKSAVHWHRTSINCKPQRDVLRSLPGYAGPPSRKNASMYNLLG